MSEKKFKVGDKVVMKTGSPQMIVSRFTEVEGVTYVQCDWFDGKPQSHAFSEVSLEYAKEAKEREKRKIEKFEKGLPDNPFS